MREPLKSFGERPRQVAVIPVRRAADGAPQVCLIRRRTSTQWGIPKGYIDRGHTHKQAALAEADEEAGLDGRVTGEMIGTYDYEKASVLLTVAVYVMEVTDERATWDEMRWRERRWCSLEEVDRFLRGHPAWALYDRIRPQLTSLFR